MNELDSLRKKFYENEQGGGLHAAAPFSKRDTNGGGVKMKKKPTKIYNT